MRPQFKTLEELRENLAVSLGFGAVPGAIDLQIPILTQFLQHVNNAMSNMVMLFVAGGRMRDVVPAAVSLRKKDTLYREALEQGLVGEAVDVAGLQEMFVGLNNADNDGIIMNTLVGRLLKRADKYTGRVASRAGKAMQTAYRVEDEVFKLALYRLGRERGLPHRLQPPASAPNRTGT